jgi:hypothetical protein
MPLMDKTSYTIVTANTAYTGLSLAGLSLFPGSVMLAMTATGIALFIRETDAGRNLVERAGDIVYDLNDRYRNWREQAADDDAERERLELQIAADLSRDYGIEMPDSLTAADREWLRTEASRAAGA